MGPSWDQHVDAKAVKTLMLEMCRKLDTDRMFKEWLQIVSTYALNMSESSKDNFYCQYPTSTDWWNITLIVILTIVALLTITMSLYFLKKI